MISYDMKKIRISLYSTCYILVGHQNEGFFAIAVKTEGFTNIACTKKEPLFKLQY